MSLISCPECLKKISNTAHNCPSCGYILNKQSLSSSKNNGQKNFIVISSLLGLTGGTIGFTIGNTLIGILGTIGFVGGLLKLAYIQAKSE